jgi:alpha-L-rhamnosidase
MMIKKIACMPKTAVLFLLLLFLFAHDVLLAADKGASIVGLEVEYTSTPIGIDVKTPRFSWQMLAPEGSREYSQTAYQVTVKDATGKLVWNSNKVKSGVALGIVYTGSPLKGTTRYTWTVRAWDQTGRVSSGTSWFETGLMDTGMSGWNGAQWIGGGDGDLVLYAHYLPLFDLKYKLTITPGSKRASVIFAANDPRLMDSNKNIFQIANKKNEAYFKVELDISALENGGNAQINIYRAGYSNGDIAGKVIKSFPVKPDVIGKGNQNEAHQFLVHNEYGTLTLSVDNDKSFFIPEEVKNEPAPGGFPTGNRGAFVTLNPLGPGHDVISYGMLGDIGFSADAGQKASFSDLAVSNIRMPGNILFKEDLGSSGYKGIFKTDASDPGSGLTVKDGAYQINGGSNGAFIVADPSHNAMPMLRAKFDAANKSIATARLYVTARGIYEIYLNGKRVGDDYYNPGLTQYNKTHLYQTYDVTGMVSKGPNAIGAMLGEGWWSGMLSYGAIWNHFGDRQSLLAKLVITYADGSKDVITTQDKNWKYYNKGPIIYSSLDMGEVDDATREQAVKDWSTANYDDRNWQKAVEIGLKGTTYSGDSQDFAGNRQTLDFDHVSLIGQIGNSAGIYKILTAKSMKEIRTGVYVYDMGQNFVGVPKISIKNGRAGEKVTLRYAEISYPDLKESGKNVGMIMTENYRAALSQDIYIMKDGDQVIQPHFTSHGYQYIEITGIKEPLALNAVQGLAISSIKKLTADYATSNPKVNQLWSNLTWSNIDNFLTIPTDCPQRNERMGWSGDISVFSQTATYVSNADQFLRRHMIAMRDLQTDKGRFTDIAPVGGGFGGIIWGSAGITVAWEAYQQYNDISLLAEHYDAMCRYMAYIESTIDQKTGLSSDGVLGDWLGPQYLQLGTAFPVTAYHVYDLGIMAKVAGILGKKEDAQKFRERYNERKDFFNRTFVNTDKKAVGLVGGGLFGGPAKREFKVSDTQTAYAVGLALGTFADENISYMVKNLAAAVERENKDDQGIVRSPYSLMTGFVGTAGISKALSDHGYSGLAYRMLQNEHYPSWLYAIDQGATTIWERLNGYTVEHGFGGNNSMNSFNHYSFGAIGQWMMAYSIGIQRDEPGFKKFILQPEPDLSGQMTWAKGYYDSPYGRINSSWKVDGKVLIYKATVPANTTATLYLPAVNVKSVSESGKPVSGIKGISFVRFEGNKAIYKLGPGSYDFKSKL